MGGRTREEEKGWMIRVGVALCRQPVHTEAVRPRGGGGRSPLGGLGCV